MTKPTTKKSIAQKAGEAIGKVAKTVKKEQVTYCPQTKYANRSLVERPTRHVPYPATKTVDADTVVRYVGKEDGIEYAIPHELIKRHFLGRNKSRQEFTTL